MAIQTATTADLDDAQRIVIEQSRFTAEHNAPVIGLFEKFSLKQGEKSITVPKVGQMTAQALDDGVDLTDSEDIGMSVTTLTSSEVGLKVYLTYKLIRQLNESAFRIVGRQMGDAVARKKDTDGIALFSALNGGTVFGADNKNMTLANYSACITTGKASKWPTPIVAAHHPNAIYQLLKSTVITPSATYGIPTGPLNENLKNFFKFSFNGVDLFEDGNIAAESGVDSGIGAIFSKSALAYVEQMGFTTERDKDISLRAWEIVVTTDYGVFELDDSYGAGMQYELGNPSTSA